MAVRGEDFLDRPAQTLGVIVIMTAVIMTVVVTGAVVVPLAGSGAGLIFVGHARRPFDRAGVESTVAGCRVARSAASR